MLSTCASLFVAAGGEVICGGALTITVTSLLVDNAPSDAVLVIIKKPVPIYGLDEARARRDLVPIVSQRGFQLEDVGEGKQVPPFHYKRAITPDGLFKES